MTKRVFTIPPAEPFLDRLAEGLWKQAKGDPLALGDMEILLPTRRAGLYLRRAFLRATGGTATILPRLMALGDLDESEFYFAESDLSLAPAIAPLRRQLLLARLIEARDREMPPDQAAQLASALGDLLDEVQTERRDFSGLEKLVPAEYARHWQETVRFLKILTDNWPLMLEEEGGLDPAERRNRLLDAQAELWRRHPPAHPVIAAGSTGSIPATADLLDVIASLPQGAVVLPGLDGDLDEEAWQAITDEHPQFGMKQLLEKFGVVRAKVALWPGCEKAAAPRARLLNEAMRPAEVTDAWRALDAKKIPRAAIKGLARLVCENAQEEAAVIALCLRAALEKKGKTAALVTPDRDLAARVAAQLARWGIEADDSAGAPLSTQPIGGFLAAMLDAARPDAGAVDYLSLLKHPFAACGRDPAICRAKAREAEMKIFRAREPGEEQGDITQWLDAFKNRFEPLARNWRQKRPFGEWLKAHLEVAEELAASDKEKGTARLWKGEAGEAAAAWCDELRAAARDFSPLTGAEYADLFTALMREVTVRPSHGRHPRIAILGLLEARLIRPDLVVLGGLNEGTWPPEAAIDPWMSRVMKRDFGLPLPERRIGLAAHDFVQLASAPEVLLTRARRAGHAPTVPSRFLLQLETVLEALGWHGKERDALAPKEPWALWARMLDEPSRISACAAPAPKPPLKARPSSLRVTEIGLWRRNPYAIYARHVLRLEKLQPLDIEANAAERGTIIHRALEQFLRQHPGRLPPNALDELLRIGRGIFAGCYPWPEVEAFWWPRFERLAAWFVERMRARSKAGIAVVKAEAAGTMAFAKGAFGLRGRADRIDKLPDGTLAIIDYKTGAVPTGKDIHAGYEPQLPLLALMAEAGGFEGIARAKVSALSYWKLAGGAEPGEEKPVKGDAGTLAAAAREGLEELIAAFADPETPYLAAPKPGAMPRYDDYAHLARYAEWGRAGEEEP